jgi:GDPmannose 4,6-dehydratase
MYGKVKEIPQKETTPFHPRSPYACAKVFAHNIAINYREAYGMYICNGILFNHESPRRGGTFVTKKIVHAFAKIKAGQQECLYLGNLDAKRDWGYAKDYVEAMWLMLQQEEPDDYVIATGETHSVREFCEEAAKYFGWELLWKGEGLDEKGIDKNTRKVLISVDPEYFRPAEVDFLLGDATKAREKLGWKPKVKFTELVKIMCEAELV